MSNQNFSIAARPHMNGASVQVSVLCGTNRDPKHGNMTKAGEFWLKPEEWAAFNRVLQAARLNVNIGCGLEIMDGTTSAPDGKQIVDYSRNWD